MLLSGLQVLVCLIVINSIASQVYAQLINFPCHCFEVVIPVYPQVGDQSLKLEPAVVPGSPSVKHFKVQLLKPVNQGQTVKVNIVEMLRYTITRYWRYPWS